MTDAVDQALAGLRRLWEEAGGTEELPPQSAFDAFVLRPWLGNIAMVEVHGGPKRFFFRLTGSKIDHVYGRNFTGQWLEDPRIAGSEGYWEKMYARVVDERQPLPGSVAIFDPRWNQKMCRWLLLPLRADLPPRGGPNATGLVVLACVMFID